MLQHIVLAKTHFAGNDNPFRFCLHAVKLNALLTLGQFNASQPGKIVKVPPGAPEFAVRHGLQADGLLSGNHFTNTLIFNPPQRIRIYSAVFKVGASRFQPGRP